MPSTSSLISNICCCRFFAYISYCWSKISITPQCLFSPIESLQIVALTLPQSISGFLFQFSNNCKNWDFWLTLHKQMDVIFVNFHLQYFKVRSCSMSWIVCFSSLLIVPKIFFDTCKQKIHDTLTEICYDFCVHTLYVPQSYIFR